VFSQIRDAGEGIDPRQDEHIVESFFTAKPEGVGMGLLIKRSVGIIARTVKRARVFSPDFVSEQSNPRKNTSGRRTNPSGIRPAEFTFVKTSKAMVYWRKPHFELYRLEPGWKVNGLLF
jgi:hypothetical protein